MANKDISVVLEKMGVYEMLMEDIDDENAPLRRYINSLALNLIVTSLTKQLRLKFYNYIEIGDSAKALDLINKQIPNFENDLIKKAGKFLGRDANL